MQKNFENPALGQIYLNTIHGPRVGRGKAEGKRDPYFM